MSPVEVITSVQRRRRWTAEHKRTMVEEAEQPGMSISSVARKYDAQASKLAGMFIENFKEYAGKVPARVAGAGPKI